MTNPKSDPNLLAKLRYNKIKTPFSHFTLIAEGRVREELKHGFSCPIGPAFMGMQAWAISREEAFDMIRWIGEDIGFSVTGKIQLYDSDPLEPPGPNPHGYGINFTPYAG